MHLDAALRNHQLPTRVTKILNESDDESSSGLTSFSAWALDATSS